MAVSFSWQGLAYILGKLPVRDAPCHHRSSCWLKSPISHVKLLRSTGMGLTIDPITFLLCWKLSFGFTNLFTEGGTIGNPPCLGLNPSKDRLGILTILATLEQFYNLAAIGSRGTFYTRPSWIVNERILVHIFPWWLWYRVYIRLAKCCNGLSIFMITKNGVGSS